MSDRENQKRLDRLAMEYLEAVEAGDFDAIETLWVNAETDAGLAEMLHGLNAELVAEQDAQVRTAVGEEVLAAMRQHMPSAEVIGSERPPVTVAMVAEHLRKHPPAGLTSDELRVNDLLRVSAEVLPADLGVPQVIAWGRRFGAAPESYWKAFRAAALKLLMQRESAENYQMAARPAKPKPEEKK
jgi:hypothetical protein